MCPRYTLWTYRWVFLVLAVAWIKEILYWLVSTTHYQNSNPYSSFLPSLLTSSHLQGGSTMKLIKLRFLWSTRTRIPSKSQYLILHIYTYYSKEDLKLYKLPDPQNLHPLPLNSYAPFIEWPRNWRFWLSWSSPPISQVFSKIINKTNIFPFLGVSL